MRFRNTTSRGNNTKKRVLGAALALLASTTVASAADMEYERQLGLIVSGVVDKWAGVQFIDDSINDDTVFANGGEGRLSLPLGNNWSIQTDVKYEYNENALNEAFSANLFGPRYHFQGAAHMSWRDPSSFLLGAFGGAGVIGISATKYDVNFVGAEAQVYLDNLTLYAQGGYVNYKSRPSQAFPLGPVVDDGLFARGVARWFITPESRIQLEASYFNIDQGATDEAEIFAAGARYDFSFNAPILGQMPLYVAWRGTFRDKCAFGREVDDHTFMIGSSYSFSGDMLTVDRQGATLDTPNFNHGCVGGSNLVSDRRLKTDIVALGTDAAGNRIYSWKYKSDPVTTWVGVMAQDLVETHPEALVVDANGYYAVRYDLIGAQMMTLEQWNHRSL